MFDSALELITEAASNSLFVFCLCNLIIVVILIGSKPTSSFEQGSESPASLVAITNAHGKQEVSSMQSFQRSIDVKELSKSNPQQEQEATIDDDCDGKEVGNENVNSEEEGGDDDDELRRRVEEFIEKVNRGWKEERMRTHNLVQAY